MDCSDCSAVQNASVLKRISRLSGCLDTAALNAASFSAALSAFSPCSSPVVTATSVLAGSAKLLCILGEASLLQSARVDSIELRAMVSVAYGKTRPSLVAVHAPMFEGMRYVDEILR